MGTYLRVHSERYPINTNRTAFTWFSITLCSCALDKRSLSIGKVKHMLETTDSLGRNDIKYIFPFPLRLALPFVGFIKW